MDEIYGREGSQRADECGKYDQAQVMFLNDARINSEHQDTTT
jgi:hypothetical protein